MIENDKTVRNSHLRDLEAKSRVRDKLCRKHVIVVRPFLVIQILASHILDFSQ